MNSKWEFQSVNYLEKLVSKLVHGWKGQRKQRMFVSILHVHKVRTSSLSFGKYFSVGKLWILMSSSSLAVESILAMTTSSFSLNFSPSWSQMGANCLQWPHHGASETQKFNNPGFYRNEMISLELHLKTALSGWYLRCVANQVYPDKSAL